MTVLSVAPLTVQATRGPKTVPAGSPVSRIEIGDGATPTRVFDAAGRQLFMLPSRPRPAADADPLIEMIERYRTGAGDAIRAARAASEAVPAVASDPPRAAVTDARARGWIDQLMPSAAGREARRAALVRDFGASQGAIRGLDRFVTNAGGATTEVLADPAWAVPVEINVARNGLLVSQTVVGYEQDPGAGLVRRRIHSEQLLSAESGDRAVADVEFSSIRLDRGGLR
jgi:hypothetical protein